MAMKAQDPNHQATRELLSFHFLNLSPHLYALGIFIELNSVLVVRIIHSIPNSSVA